MEFIDIIQKSHNGEERKSSLTVDSSGMLRVIGVLPHGSSFRPAGPRDREKLRAWLDSLSDQDWEKFVTELNS